MAGPVPGVCAARLAVESLPPRGRGLAALGMSGMAAVRTSGPVRGRVPTGGRPRNPLYTDQHRAPYVDVEARNGRPFKPYVYRGAGPFVKPTIEPGECGCGCGEAAPISTRTDRRYGAIKGEPRRFILGHNVVRPPRKVA